MQLYRKFGWAFAVALVVAGASPVHAAWCNVFQVCCFNCRTPRTANYVAAAPDTSCNSCPQQTCTTRYVQRCYYQPVTCYQTKTCYEPVTTYRTSYYYEPVTSYRYSCYYDPCTCTSQQVATPVTCYQLRSQCCPVQSWVQRCSQVPVTTYKQSFYYEPVTSCSQSSYSTCDTCGPLAAYRNRGTAGHSQCPGAAFNHSAAGGAGSPRGHEPHEQPRLHDTTPEHAADRRQLVPSTAARYCTRSAGRSVAAADGQAGSHRGIACAEQRRWSATGSKADVFPGRSTGNEVVYQGVKQSVDPPPPPPPLFREQIFFFLKKKKKKKPPGSTRRHAFFLLN